MKISLTVKEAIMRIEAADGTEVLDYRLDNFSFRADAAAGVDAVFQIKGLVEAKLKEKVAEMAAKAKAEKQQPTGDLSDVLNHLNAKLAGTER